MLEEIKQREKGAVHELLHILSKCLGIGQMLKMLEGKRGQSGKSPVKKSVFAKQVIKK